MQSCCEYNWIKAHGESTRSAAGVDVVEMGSDFFTVKWVSATPKQAESYGMPLKIKA